MPRVLTPEDLRIIEELSSEFWRDFMLPIEVKRYRDFGGLAGAAAVVRRAVERGLVDDEGKLIDPSTADVSIIAPRKGPDPAEGRIGRWIRSRRVLHGVKQEELAEALGVSKWSMCRIETGNRRVSALELTAIAEFLGEDAATLVNRARGS